nr:hypothetical protein [uncultured Aliiroseovarius sp.]
MRASTTRGFINLVARHVDHNAGTRTLDVLVWSGVIPNTDIARVQFYFGSIAITDQGPLDEKIQLVAIKPVARDHCAITHAFAGTESSSADHERPKHPRFKMRVNDVIFGWWSDPVKRSGKRCPEFVSVSYGNFFCR